MNRAKRSAQVMDWSLRRLMMVWGYRFVLLMLLVAGIYALKAVPLPVVSGITAMILTIYMVLMVVLQRIYRACEIGQVRVSELIMSQLLAEGICAGNVYLCGSLYIHRLYNPLGLLAVLGVQCLVGVLWSIWANRLYFASTKKPRTAVIYQQDWEPEMLYQSAYFHDKYDVVCLIKQPEEDLDALRAQLDGCEVLFVLGIPAAQINSIAKLCVELNVKGYFAPRLGHIVMAGAQHQVNFSIPLLCVERAGDYSEYRAFKRLFDVVVSGVALVLLLPVMAITALAIWLEDHGPVFYRQVRLSKNGKKFKIIKFRSMTVNAEKDGVARLAGENDSRITKVGRFIRACRLDELPQLLNILVGDMSIVGPRPERPEISKRYEETLPEFPLRLQVKAGLTGLAQVYGRYNTEHYHKLLMDLIYINEMSFLKDLQLILATVKILFVQESTHGAEKQDALVREHMSSNAKSA